MADIHIIDANGVFKVRPAVTKLDKRARDPLEIEFRNLTATGAELVFPSGLLDPGQRSHVPVPADGSAAVVVSIRASGFYEYQVLMVAERSVVSASGESAPGMIIDP
ncbi:MAG: hypothetical protein MUE47_10260 [Acidobacteria bacterium]|nr:hypothetical protein [Acidobacteriota bacterium]